MRSLVALAVRRRVTVLMCALAMAAFGVVGYNRLPFDLLPDISYPSLTVQTDFPDTAPAEVENLVTRPVEEAVGVLRGLRTVHSVSRPGVSEVTLEFDWGADMDLLLLDVREKLDRLILPEEAEDPVVLRFDPSLDPIVRIALGGTGDLTESRRLADRRLKQAFETISGVASARIKGGLEEEIHVNVDQERLAALGIPLDRVRQVVGVSNINLPGGSLKGTDTQFLIRTVNEYESVEEIGGLVVTAAAGSLVRVRDVAEVHWGAREREEIIRVDGVESVEIAIYKEGDANIVTTARSIREQLPEMGRLVPEGYRLTVLFDQSRFIEQALKEVRSAAVIGGALAVIVLMFFLRDLRSTVIIATSIPLSVLFAFVAMYRLDVSLNIMSLGGSDPRGRHAGGQRHRGARVYLPQAAAGRWTGGGGGGGNLRGGRGGGGVHPHHGGGVSADRLRGGNRRRPVRRHGDHGDPQPGGVAGGSRHPDSHAQRHRQRWPGPTSRARGDRAASRPAVGSRLEGLRPIASAGLASTVVDTFRERRWFSPSRSQGSAGCRPLSSRRSPRGSSTSKPHSRKARRWKLPTGSFGAWPNLSRVIPQCRCLMPPPAAGWCPGGCP